MSDTVFIYALNCPITGRTRYVGKAKDIKARFAVHVSRSRKESSHKDNWIRSLEGRGQLPTVEILDEVPEELWPQWEVAWIAFYREQGFDLVNATVGGEGVNNPSSETRAKLSVASKRWHSFNPVKASSSAEANEKRRKAMLGRVFSEEHRLKIKIARQRQVFSPETCAKIRASSLGKIRGPYKKKKI